MSQACNVTQTDLSGDIDKSQVRDHFTTAGQQALRAGADIFTALSYVETLDYEASVDDLEQCANRLDEAVEHLQKGISLMEEGLPLTDEAESYFKSFDYDGIKSRAEMERLFLDDTEAWNTLIKQSQQVNVLAGPRMYLSMLTELRSQIRGFVSDIQSDQPDDHLLRASWRIMTQFSRAVNVAGMLSYFNRETRTPAGTGDAPSKESLEAGSSLVDS